MVKGKLHVAWTHGRPLDGRTCLFAVLACALMLVLAIVAVPCAQAASAQADGVDADATDANTSEASGASTPGSSGAPSLSVSQSAVPVSLTQQERDYLAEHPTVSIAMDTSWVPYAFVSDDGSVAGVLANLLDRVADAVGLSVDYVACDSYADALAKVQSGETQLVSGIADDEAMAAKNGIERTNPYINVNYCAVSKGDLPDLFVEGAAYRVAVCVGSYSTMAMQARMPSYEYVEYYSNEECMDAVLSGDVDVALIASYAADYYRGEVTYADLHSTLINDFNWGLCFGVNPDVDPLLIDILNKGIASMSVNDASQAVYLGMMKASSENNSIAAWVEKNQTAIFIAVGAGLFAVFDVVVLLLWRHGRILRKQRDTDGLTGLSTRLAFESLVSKYLASSQQTAAFVIVDLDGFKGINDEFGHSVGDEALRAVGDAMRASFRDTDYLARLGGDEFVVFMPDCPGAAAQKRVEGLLGRVASVAVAGHPDRLLSMSAGIAECPRDGTSFAELYRRADGVLYQAKQGGKGRVALTSRS